MRKPFKERPQFWCLFFLGGFPSTHYQSRQSWFKMQEQLGCFICIPVGRSNSAFGTRTDTTSSRTRRREEAWPPTSDESAGSAQLATTVRPGGGGGGGPPPVPFFFFLLGCPLPNQWQRGVKCNLPNDVPVPYLGISDQSNTRKCAHFVISGQSEVKARGILVISVEWDVDSSWSSKSDLTGAGTLRSDQLTAAIGFQAGLSWRPNSCSAVEIWCTNWQKERKKERIERKNKFERKKEFVWKFDAPNKKKGKRKRIFRDNKHHWPKKWIFFKSKFNNNNNKNKKQELFQCIWGIKSLH